MVSSEWNLFRLSTERRCVWHLIFLGAVQLADRIRLHLPSPERHGDLVLSVAELLLVGAAHQRALDVDVIALAQSSRRVFAAAVPGTLSRQRKNCVFAVCRLERVNQWRERRRVYRLRAVQPDGKSRVS
jgi:hypothetical protein